MILRLLMLLTFGMKIVTNFGNENVSQNFLLNITNSINKLLILVYNYMGEDINKFKIELAIPEGGYTIQALNETIQNLLNEHNDRKAVQFFLDPNTKHVIMEVARCHVVVFNSESFNKILGFKYGHYEEGVYISKFAFE